MEARVEALEALAASVQTNVASEAKTEAHKRVEADLLAKQVKGAALYQVPASYYSLSLRERATLLACPVDRLCKTLVYENLSAAATLDPSAPIGKRKYIAVVVQYVGKVLLDNLERYLRSAGKGDTDLRLVLAAGAEELTGFQHNAVTIYGCKTPLPVVLAKPLAYLEAPAFVWLGGGEVDLKLRMFISELHRSLGPLPIVDCTVARSADEEVDG